MKPTDSTTSTARPSRKAARIVALICVVICALNLIARAVFAITGHHGFPGSPVFAAAGLLTGLVYLAAARRRP